MHRQGRILIVDDEEKWRKELVETLTRGGFLVDAAAGANEALERLNELPYHVIVLDIRMADTDQSNVEGIDLLEKAIRTRFERSNKGHHAFRVWYEGTYAHVL